MKKYLLCFLWVIFASCLNEGQSVEPTSNGDVNLTFLFEHDGCKIYRFIDGGKAVYFTDCRGKIEYDYSKPTGKNTSVRENMQNETIK